MTPYRNILTLEYNTIEAKVFMQYFDNPKNFNYLGNYQIDSDLEDLVNSSDIILININTINYRNCVSFLQNHVQKNTSFIFLTSNIYFDNLAQLVHHYNVKIIMKPLRKDCLLHFINQSLINIHHIFQQTDDIIGSNYIFFIQSFLDCNDDNFSIWSKKAFMLLKEKHLEKGPPLQDNLQIFASLLIYFITQDLAPPQIIQITRYYNDLLHYIKMPYQSKYLLQKMAVFFKNCYTIIRSDYVSVDQKRIVELKQRIQYYIEEEHDFSLDTIAQEMHISVSHLSKIFKKIEKITYREYIHSLRLNKACHLLSNSDQTIEEVAERCGYQEISSFSRAFKDAFNLSPLNYRKKHNNS
ncbi:hypothetical protein CMETHOX_40210 [Lacrimispora indolis]|nr:hypothetical protein CMETHOX_40210 [[Clostridium] methoxybenzovorans]